MSSGHPHTILIAERFALEALVELRRHPELRPEPYSDKLAPEAEALLIRSKFRIDAVALDKCPRLRLVVTCTSGFDHIDLNETEKRGITVMFTPEANAVSAAELTWSLLMAANRRVGTAHREIQAGRWERESFLSHELAGKTLGIAGLGRIGTRVAGFAHAFGMNVLAYDPYQPEDVFTRAGARRVSYEEVLKGADFLTFHVPATFETRHMFGRPQIEYVHPELVLINTSRGSVIAEEDLAQALLDGKIKFAALDVFAKEPLPRDSKLLKCRNVLLTPHLGAYTEEAFRKASLEGARRVIDFFENNTTQNTLPLKNDWGSLSFAERD